MVTKDGKFKKHQEQIFQRLLDILELKEADEYEVRLHDLSEDVEKKKKIIELKEEVKLFFNAANITVFKTDRNINKREYYYVLVAIFKLMGFSKSVEEIKEEYKKYVFLRFKKV